MVRMPYSSNRRSGWQLVLEHSENFAVNFGEFEEGMGARCKRIGACMGEKPGQTRPPLRDADRINDHFCLQIRNHRNVGWIRKMTWVVKAMDKSVHQLVRVGCRSKRGRSCVCHDPQSRQGT